MNQRIHPNYAISLLPQVTDTSLILEPEYGGVRVPTFKVEDWMYLRYPHRA